MPLAHWLAGGRNAEPILDVPSPVDPAIRLNLRLIPYSSDYWLLIARDVSKLLRLEQVRRDFVANCFTRTAHAAHRGPRLPGHDGPGGFPAPARCWKKCASRASAWPSWWKTC
jgi:hypothetical protein